MPEEHHRDYQAIRSRSHLETGRGQYRSTGERPSDTTIHITGKMSNFYSLTVGNSCGASDVFKRRLVSQGQLTEVSSLELCDFVLAFCVNVSRLGTDIEAALAQIPGGKQIILVVLHHTIDIDPILPESSRHVTRPEVILAVDCVFHETQALLMCNRNDMAIDSVLRLVGSTQPRRINQVPGIWSGAAGCVENWRRRPVLCIILILIIIGIISLALYFIFADHSH